MAHNMEALEKKDRKKRTPLPSFHDPGDTQGEKKKNGPERVPKPRDVTPREKNIKPKKKKRKDQNRNTDTTICWRVLRDRGPKGEKNKSWGPKTEIAMKVEIRVKGKN